MKPLKPRGRKHGDVGQTILSAGLADFPVRISAPGDWKVARNGRQECLPCNATVLSMLAVVFIMFAATWAHASGTVSNCTQAALLSAVAGGGTATFDTDCSITLTEPINILADTTIDANGHNVSLSGGNAVSLFKVRNKLTLIGITLANGLATNHPGGAVYIYPSGTLRATNCNFAGNSSKGVNGTAGSNGSDNSDGKGNDGSDGTSGTTAYGGALYNLGNLTLISCSLTTNTVTAGNGGNGGNGGAGGGTLSQGGNGGRAGDGGAAYGGAVYNQSNLTLIDCSFTANTAIAGNGGIGGTNGGGNFAGMIGIGGAAGAAFGGAVYNLRNLTTHGCTFSRNSVQGGNSASGGNQNSGMGSTGAPGGDALGGALCSTWWAVLTNSTFASNTTKGGRGGNGGGGTGTLSQAGNGGNGGTAAGGGVYNNATFRIVNCTFSNNGATGGTNGVAGSANFAGSDGNPGLSLGGNLAAEGGTLELLNSILNASSSGANADGSFSDEGYNLSSDSVASFTASTSLQNTNPALGSLANNGGPTLTMALSKGSPALDRIPASLAPDVDQRGVPRPQGSKSDIGAFEYTTSNLPLITQQPQDLTVAPGSSATFSVTAAGTGPLSYQWQFNGTNIVGATLSSYSITNVQTTDAGTYDVLVSNSFGSTTSSNAVLTIVPTLTITNSTNGLIQISGPATPGATYTVQASTNLLNWLDISTNTTPLLFIDGTSNFPARFYRLKQ